jgi:pyoverdine/dityrosine biosynthesis protein Dit1
LIEARFSDAVRLSIHPQSCGAKKIGIRLSASALWPDSWQTPWHGVAVDTGGRFMLLKRAQAEALGARLIHREGRPSHYILSDEAALSKLQGPEYGV